MKKVLSLLFIALIKFSAYSVNPIYITFNQSYVIEIPNEINYHGLQVWEFDKESMTLTFFDTMKSFPITTWEDKEENKKHIIADLDEFSASVIIDSPWVITVYFWKHNDDETYSYTYGQTFYLEDLPDWYFMRGEGKYSYWIW